MSEWEGGCVGGCMSGRMDEWVSGRGGREPVPVVEVALLVAPGHAHVAAVEDHRTYPR